MKTVLSILVISCIALSSCHLFGKRVKGNGHITSTEHTVAHFRNVDVSGAFDLYLAQGESKPVRIEGDENLLQYVEIKVDGDELEVETREGVNLRPTQKIKIYVTAPVFNSIQASGASNISSVSKIINADRMKLDVTGAGDINMELTAPAVEAQVSGAGSVNLKGETKNFDLDLTGAGKAHCFDFLSESTKVEISGAGDADVFASVSLEAQLSGAGTVSYKGGATNIKQQVSGAGSIRKVD